MMFEGLQSPTLMWKKEREPGGGQVHFSRMRNITVGDYQDMNTDIAVKVNSDGEVITSAEGGPIETKIVPINTVFDDDPPATFFQKCLANQSAFTHFWDNTNQTAHSSIPYREGQTMLAQARHEGKYEIAKRLDSKGFEVGDDEMKQRIKELEADKEKLEAEKEELEKKVLALQKTERNPSPMESIDQSVDDSLSREVDGLSIEGGSRKRKLSWIWNTFKKRKVDQTL